MTREERRAFYAEKNARRRANKQKGDTIYAEAAREARRGVTGFGKVTPDLFNKLAEGTGAMRRSEID